MTTEVWGSVFGALASICLVLGYLPQAITTIRTRETDGIALSTFIMLGLGSLFFTIQGIMICVHISVTAGWALVLTNAIATICSVIIFVIKIINDSKKRKR